MKFHLLIPCIVLSLGAGAQNYQSITNASVTHIDHGSEDVRYYSLNSKYYFEDKNTLGPVDQFAYINTISNFSAGYTQWDNLLNDENSDLKSISGEVFLDRFMFSASRTEVDTFGLNNDNTSISVGYLFNDDLLVSSTASKLDGKNTQVSFSAKYNHQINSTDFFGITANIDEDFENENISATYLSHLANGKYIKLTADYSVQEHAENNWHVKGQYFFTDYTSAFLSQKKGNTREVGIKHFFNDHIGLSASYINSNDSDINSVNLTMTLQL
jgi:hypothetical protein